MDNSTQATKIREYLTNHGKNNHSWAEIANMFNVPGTNRQKGEYVRGLARRLQDNNITQATKLVWDDASSDYRTSDTKLVRSAGVAGYFDPQRIGRINLLSVDEMMENSAKSKREYEEFIKWKEGKIESKSLPRPYLNGDPNNVIVLGDIHEPFCKEGYLEFCREQQERFNCGTVVFIGDCTDQNFSSFHTIDPDGMSAGMELDAAIARLQRWYKVFPIARVCSSNHDRIISRKIFSSGLSQRWMRPMEEVLGVPNWKFVEEVVHNNVLYIHGEGGTAIKKAQNELKSCVQGHLHTEGYIQLFNGGKNFAMQVGCGIDFKQYAFAYAQRGKLPILSCGVVLNQSPILIPFN